MMISISQPDLLRITDGNGDLSFFGGIQSWYSTEWRRRGGCGPTCAANILAYLAFSRPELRALYGYESMSLPAFAQHMEEVYEFVRPGVRGLHQAEVFSEGSVAFAKSRGALLHPHVFSALGNRNRDRHSVSELLAFVRSGLSSNCPIGFLNLTRGKVKSIQGWHWITITEARAEDCSLFVTASDEGQRISFDLRLWYLTTRMNGGLVYFTS